MSITFDNTSATNMFKDQLRPILNGSLFYGRCICHIINLIIQVDYQKLMIT